MEVEGGGGWVEVKLPEGGREGWRGAGETHAGVMTEEGRTSVEKDPKDRDRRVRRQKEGQEDKDTTFLASILIILL